MFLREDVERNRNCIFSVFQNGYVLSIVSRNDVHVTVYGVNEKIFTLAEFI